MSCGHQKGGGTNKIKELATISQLAPTPISNSPSHGNPPNDNPALALAFSLNKHNPKKRSMEIPCGHKGGSKCTPRYMYHRLDKGGLKKLLKKHNGVILNFNPRKTGFILKDIRLY